MPPAWKLRRELARLGHQIAGLPRSLVRLPERLLEPRRRRRYDATFPDALQQTDGARPPGPRTAVLVMYQPGGVARSTLDTVRWLAAGGYAPLVVSNAPLSAADRAALAAEAWRVVERPNFGYDFGAYRDAIWLIRSAAPTPQRLILMNDSIWCPIPQPQSGRPDPLERIAALDVDLGGFLQDEKVAHDRQGGKPTDCRFIESCFLSVSARLWQARAFQDFWDAYPLTDYKPHTIRNGEIGLSRAMEAAGFSLGALSDRSRFRAALSGMEPAQLALVLRHGAYDEPGFDAERTQLLARWDQLAQGSEGAGPAAPRQGAQAAVGGTEVEAWRAEVLDHVRRWLNRRRFNAALPLGNDRIFGTIWIKKAHGPIFVAGRRAYLAATDAGLIAPPPPDLRAEIAART